MGSFKHATVVSGDALWRMGPMLEGAASQFLRQEVAEWHLLKALRGFWEMGEMKGLLRFSATPESELEAQRVLFSILIDSGAVTRKQVYQFMSRAILAQEDGFIHAVLGIEQLNGHPVFLSTAAGGSAAISARSNLLPKSMLNTTSNKEVYTDGILTGFQTPIATGEEKLAATEEMLGKHGFTIGDCQVIGFSTLDIPLLKASRKPIAAPWADPEVRSLRRVMDTNR